MVYYWIFVYKFSFHFVPVQSKFNEPELRKYFEKFCDRMGLKQHNRDEPTSSSIEMANIRTKVSWKLQEGMLIGKYT